VPIKQNFCAEKKRFLHHVKIIPPNNLSGLGSISARLTELKKEYLKEALNKQNPLIYPLIEEYLSSRSEIEKEGSSPSILTGVESIT